MKQKKRDYKNPFFIEYAKADFRKSPENLLEVVRALDDEEFRIKAAPARFESMASRIIDLVKHNKPDAFNELQKKYTAEGEHSFNVIPFEAAVDAVYRYRGGYCENRCTDGKQRRETLGLELFSGSNRLRCFECEQLYFKAILNSVSQGENLEHITGFSNLMGRGQTALERVEYIYLDQGELKRAITYNWTDPQGLGSSRSIMNLEKGYFNDALAGFVWQSLCSFLLEGDRRNIKKCSVCDLFFIAKNRKKETCSDPCEKRYNTLRKRYDREQKRKTVKNTGKKETESDYARLKMEWDSKIDMSTNKIMSVKKRKTIKKQKT